MTNKERMRKTLTILGVALVTITNAQNYFTPKLEVGDKADYQIISSEMKEEKGKIEGSKDTLNLSITVKEVKENEIIVDAVYPNAVYKIEEELGESIDMGESVPRTLVYQLRIGKNGKVKELINWEEIRDDLLKGVDLVEKKLESDSLGYLIGLAVAPVKIMFSKEQFVRAYISEELNKIFLPMGVDLDQKSAVSKMDSIDNPLGKGKITSEVVTSVQSPSPNNYVITAKSELDPETFKKLMEEIMKPMMMMFAKMDKSKSEEEIEKSINEAISKMFEGATMKYTEQTDIEVYTGDKWISKAVTSKVSDIKMGPKSATGKSTVTISKL